MLCWSPPPSTAAGDNLPSRRPHAPAPCSADPLESLLPGFLRNVRPRPRSFAGLPQPRRCVAPRFWRECRKLQLCARSGPPLPVNSGFGKVSANSLDATCDRDFVLEFLSNSALLMTHASRLAEDWIIYSATGMSLGLLSFRRRSLPEAQPDAAEKESGWPGTDTRQGSDRRRFSQWISFARERLAHRL